MQALYLHFLNLLKFEHHVYWMDLHNIFELLDILIFLFKMNIIIWQSIKCTFWAGLCLLGINCQFVVYQLFYCIQGDHMFHLKLFKHYKALVPFCYTTNLYLILFLLAKKEEKYLCCVLLKIKTVVVYSFAFY